jgi:riboflavin-specific deaminase-like protein
MAQSLDGRVALDGQHTMLSTPEGFAYAHRTRASHDAVLVGVGTVRIDNPRLTVRNPVEEGSAPRPLRVVLSSTLSVPSHARILDNDGRVLVIGASGRADANARVALEAAGAAVAIAECTPQGRVSVTSALKILAERGVKNLLVEGGPQIVTSFMQARCIDRISFEIAMRVLGAPGTASVGSLAVSSMDNAPKLANVTVERLGEHILLQGDVLYV